MSQGKTWDFTLNNPTELEVENMKKLAHEVNYLIVSKEVGKCGTPHLQGRVIFKRNYRLKQLKKLWPRNHWELSKCTKDNIYPIKSDSEVIIQQDNRKQGKRTDLDDLKKMIDDKRPMNELWDKHFGTMLRYSRGVKEYIKVSQPTIEKAEFKEMRFEKITCWETPWIVWGEPGIGKTEFALQHFEKPFFCCHIDQLLDYVPENHDGIIFDDMKFNHWPRESQIHILDTNQTRAIHCRHYTATIPRRTKKIFCTNVYGGHIFDLDDGAIERRVKVKNLKK